jgi:hypothetical protein
MVRSLTQIDAEQFVDARTFRRIEAARTAKPFASVEEVWGAASISIAAMTAIAHANGFVGMDLSRREALQTE